MCVCEALGTDTVLQAHLVPRHQLLPGHLNGQATVTALSYFPVLPVLGGQAGYPVHAEYMQPLLQLVGCGDFLLGLRMRSALATAWVPSPVGSGRAVCVCVSTDMKACTTGDYRGKGTAGTWTDRHFGLQKGPWTVGSDMGSLTRKAPSEVS